METKIKINLKVNELEAIQLCKRDATGSGTIIYKTDYAKIESYRGSPNHGPFFLITLPHGRLRAKINDWIVFQNDKVTLYSEEDFKELFEEN